MAIKKHYDDLLFLSGALAAAVGAGLEWGPGIGLIVWGALTIAVCFMVFKPWAS